MASVYKENFNFVAVLVITLVLLLPHLIETILDPEIQEKQMM